MELNQYKSGIADIYNARASAYDKVGDNSDWHRRICLKLLSDADVKVSHWVLDVATGTGTIALEAARIVSGQGHVIGIDIAAEMLAIAEQKPKDLGVFDVVKFEYADAETYEHSVRFDHIFCCSALVWMSDVDGAIRHWGSLLTKGGQIHLQTHNVHAFIVSNILAEVASEMGVDIRLHKAFGSVDKLQKILADSGFDQIKIAEVPELFEVSLEKAKSSIPDKNSPLPGHERSPLAGLGDSAWNQLRDETARRLEKVAVNNVITDERTSLFAHARKRY